MPVLIRTLLARVHRRRELRAAEIAAAIHRHPAGAVTVGRPSAGTVTWPSGETTPYNAPPANIYHRTTEAGPS